MGRFQILIMVGLLFGGCRAVIIEPNSDIDIHPHIYTSNIEVVYIPRLVRPPTKLTGSAHQLVAAVPVANKN